MSRKTIYNNNLTTEEKWEKVSNEHKILMNDFLEYCTSEDKSIETLKQYTSQLKVFFCWNAEYNENKNFLDFVIKDIIKYQNFLIKLGLSPARIRSLKSALSSLSNYIEIVESDRYPNFKNIINKIKAPVLVNIREKTVLNDKDVEKILNKLIENEKIQIACYFALAAYSGARKSELLRFKVNFFNKENIKDGLYCTPKIRTKGRGNLGKQIPKYVVKKDFDKYLNKWLEQRKELGINSEWLFVQNGKQAKISTANYWMKYITNLSGINCYSHMLRHYFTSRLCKNNIPHDVIKKVIGWMNVAMISVYDDNDIKDQLGDYFSENGVKYIEKNTDISK